MAEEGARTAVEDVLATALDLCLGLGAFVVLPTGDVQVVASDAMPLDGGADRLAALARGCLDHPAARTRAMFWNAELASEGEAADRSLACVVVPVWARSVLVGLLGVADTWLPEPDDDQRAGLEHLAATLARLLCSAPGQPTAASPLRDTTAGSAEAGDLWGMQPTRRAPSAPAPRPVVDAAAVLGALDDGVVCVGADGVVVLSNRPADAFYGLGPGATLVGAALPRLSGVRTEDGEVLAPDDEPAARVARDKTPCATTVLVGEHAAGARRVRISARPLEVEGGLGVVVVLHDSTVEWTEHQRLTRYALFDPLTGLANRDLLVEELGRMLGALGRNAGSVALVYMDLDRFKEINDEHGHDVGDEVLGAIARRLRAAVRSDDVVARVGSDEFVIAHASSEPLPDGDVVVSRLRTVLASPFRVRGRVVDVGASIGWVSTERGNVGAEALLARADHAMYRHKRDAASRTGVR